MKRTINNLRAVNFFKRDIFDIFGDSSAVTFQPFFSTCLNKHVHNKFLEM